MMVIVHESIWMCQLVPHKTRGWYIFGCGGGRYNGEWWAQIERGVLLSLQKPKLPLSHTNYAFEIELA